MMNINVVAGDSWKGSLCEDTSCPAGVYGTCNGRGTCNPLSQECTCDPGWRGEACDDPVCPGDPECAGQSLLKCLHECYVIYIF